MKFTDMKRLTPFEWLLVALLAASCVAFVVTMRDLFPDVLTAYPNYEPHMSESRHTPGPWLSDLDLDGTLRAAYGTPICQVSDHNQTDANAALISAAPDLLSALKRAERVLAALKEDGFSVGHTLSDARAALAKAEGRHDGT